jgi:hypothetical protein
MMISGILKPAKVINAANHCRLQHRFKTFYEQLIFEHQKTIQN